MNLNLPITKQLKSCRNILIAGMGGGFDIFCGLPIYFELQRQGCNVHLANYSFSNIEILQSGIRLSDTLVGVTADQREKFPLPYFPELYLAQWFAQKDDQPPTIWCFHKTGAVPLLENYRILIEYLDIDGILLVDGGVDSLVRGDEEACGTLFEDALSLFAVNELSSFSHRYICCIGFGAERNIAYAHILENIATLTRAGGFLGACSLTPQMTVYKDYKEAVLSVQSKPTQDSSVINSSIISAVGGHFGNHHLTEKTRGSRLWISPLMPLYWFFDLPAVAEHNLYLENLRYTMTFADVLKAYTATGISRRPPATIPLP